MSCSFVDELKSILVMNRNNFQTREIPIVSELQRDIVSQRYEEKDVISNETELSSGAESLLRIARQERQIQNHHPRKPKTCQANVSYIKQTLPLVSENPASAKAGTE
jgi:hypothetical protein